MVVKVTSIVAKYNDIWEPPFCVMYTHVCGVAYL